MFQTMLAVGGLPPLLLPGDSAVKLKSLLLLERPGVEGELNLFLEISVFAAARPNSPGSNSWIMHICTGHVSPLLHSSQTLWRLRYLGATGEEVST